MSLSVQVKVMPSVGKPSIKYIEWRNAQKHLWDRAKCQNIDFCHATVSREVIIN